MGLKRFVLHKEREECQKFTVFLDKYEVIRLDASVQAIII